MTAHELGRLLLAGPDLEVLVCGPWGGDVNMKPLGVVPGEILVVDDWGDDVSSSPAIVVEADDDDRPLQFTPEAKHDG